MAPREVTDVFRALFPFLLSHHPLCSFYEKDTYEMLGRRFCLGCSIAYPLAFIIAFTILATTWYRSFPEPFFHQSILLLVSVLAGSIHMGKYLIRSGSLLLKIIFKIFLGISVSGIIVWIFTIPAGWPVILPAFLLFILGLGFMGTFRLYYFYGICSGCIYHGDWDLCYGFRGLNRYHSIKDLKGGRLHEVMFNRTMRRSFPVRQGTPASIKDPEPVLRDEKKWIYDDGSYSIPLVPKTGLEVGDYHDIP